MAGSPLAWATDHAERAGARLVLLHVCVPGSPLDQNRGAGAAVAAQMTIAAQSWPEAGDDATDRNPDDSLSQALTLIDSAN